MKELQELKSRVNKVSEKCEKIATAMESFWDCSYKLDLKIVGMPVLGARENAEQASNLCLRLF